MPSRHTRDEPSRHPVDDRLKKITGLGGASGEATIQQIDRGRLRQRCGTQPKKLPGPEPE
jgi:hypothetical protein